MMGNKRKGQVCLFVCLCQAREKKPKKNFQGQWRRTIIKQEMLRLGYLLEIIFSLPIQKGHYLIPLNHLKLLFLWQMYMKTTQASCANLPSLKEEKMFVDCRKQQLREWLKGEVHPTYIFDFFIGWCLWKIYVLVQTPCEKANQIWEDLHTKVELSKFEIVYKGLCSHTTFVYVYNFNISL